MKDQLLAQGEAVLEEWIRARGETPTAEAVEGNQDAEGRTRP